MMKSRSAVVNDHLVCISHMHYNAMFINIIIKYGSITHGAIINAVILHVLSIAKLDYYAIM